MDTELSAFWLFDERASTFDMYSELYVNDTSEFNENVIDTIGEELWSSNLFIVDRVEVLPKYRGNGVSKLAINEAIRLFAGNTQLCALKAFPLQFEGAYNDEKKALDEWTKRLNLDSLGNCEVNASSKLKELYQSMGFNSLSNSASYMIRQVN